MWAGPDLPGSATAVAVSIPVLTLPLAVRRSAPVVSFGLVYAAFAAQAVAGGRAEESIALAVALLVGVFSIAAHTGDRVAIAGLALGQAVAWGALGVRGDASPGDYGFSLLLGGGGWLGGYAVRSGRLVAVDLEDRARRTEELGDAERARAVSQERARIAREMHDVVAHTMSVVVVQSGAARQLLHDRPERSEQLLRSLESTSRQALSEMRRLLGLLRTDADSLAVSPQPGLGELDALVQRARDAGLDLVLRCDGEPGRLAPGVDLAAYRIAQEAVTNAIRHGAAPAVLVVRYGASEVEIEQRNALRSPPSSGADGSGGHGLIGMRERARLYGGSLEAGPRDGAFCVHARLPLGDDGA